MSRAVIRVGGILIAALLCACGESKKNTPNAGTAGTAGMPGACNDAITANAEQNYAFTSTITLPPVSVKPDSELFFEWGGVTKDLLDHPVNPMTSVDQIELVLWELTQSALEIDLNADALEMTDVGIIANIETQKAMTSASLFEFTSVGMPLTPDEILPYVNATNYPPTENIYTAIIASGIILGQGTLMMQSFVLDPESSNTTVTISDT